MSNFYPLVFTMTQISIWISCIAIVSQHGRCGSFGVATVIAAVVLHDRGSFLECLGLIEYFGGDGCW